MKDKNDAIEELKSGWLRINDVEELFPEFLARIQREYGKMIQYGSEEALGSLSFVHSIERKSFSADVVCTSLCIDAYRTGLSISLPEFFQLLIEWADATADGESVRASIGSVCRESIRAMEKLGDIAAKKLEAEGKNGKAG